MRSVGLGDFEGLTGAPVHGKVTGNMDEHRDSSSERGDVRSDCGEQNSESAVEEVLRKEPGRVVPKGISEMGWVDRSVEERGQG